MEFDNKAFESVALNYEAQMFSNSRFDPERLLVKRLLAEIWGQKEGEKTALPVFFAPIFLPGSLAWVCPLQTGNCCRMFQMGKSLDVRLYRSLALAAIYRVKSKALQKK